MPTKARQERIPATDGSGRPCSIIAIGFFTRFEGSGPPLDSQTGGILMSEKGDPLVHLRDENDEPIKGKYESATTGEIFTSTHPKAP